MFPAKYVIGITHFLPPPPGRAFSNYSLKFHTADVGRTVEHSSHDWSTPLCCLSPRAPCDYHTE